MRRTRRVSLVMVKLLKVSWFICVPIYLLSRLCVYDTQSGNIAHVTSNLEFDDIDVHFAWAPDGQQVIFAARSTSKSGQLQGHDLYVIDVGNGRLRQVTQGSTNDLMPAWSLDGEWIAYHRDCALWLIHPDGSAAQRLIAYTAGLCVVAPAWSPDSQKLAFLHIQILDELPKVGKLKILDRPSVDSPNAQVIYDFQPPFTGGSLTWSPDGQQIGCACDRDGKDIPLLLDANGGGELPHDGPLPLSWQSDFWPRWGYK